MNPFSVVSDREAIANLILQDLTRLRCALATVYSKKTSNANIDDYARDKPPQKTEEPLAEDEELHPTFWRRSAGILKRYGQDLPPRQRVEVRIPAEPSGFNRSEYRAISSGLAKGRPKI